MKNPLSEALLELKGSLGQPIQALEGQDTNAIQIQQDIEIQARIVVDMVEAHLIAMGDNNQSSEEKNKQLSALYKDALNKHYLAMVTTLNAALKEKDPNQLKVHAEKLEKLADISTPVLKAALYELVGIFTYIAALLTAAQVSSLIALAPVTYGASLAVTVPVSIAARKMQKKGDDFFSEGEKHLNDALAIKEIQEKINKRKSSKL